MPTPTQPFSTFGTSKELQEFFEIFDHPGLADLVAPRLLKDLIEAETGLMNVYLDETHNCFIRLAILHLAMSEDGTLGAVCVEDSEDLDLFVPLDRFTSWHAETRDIWDESHPMNGDKETLRLMFKDEIRKLERRLAGPGPLADEVANATLMERMDPEPVEWELGVACEEEIFQICEGMSDPIVLTVQGVQGPLTYTGHVASTHRAYDGRIGFSFETDNGHQSMPFEAVISWHLVDQDIADWDDGLAKSGGRSELEAIFADDIKDMAGDFPRYIQQNWNEPIISWNDYIADYRLGRLAGDRCDQGWANGPETRIYLALAQTLPEQVESVATRVGGALWSERNGDNAARVAWARKFTGFPISDEMLIEAATAIRDGYSARVQASALFVACGGESATPETLRRLTLLQKHCPVPRYW